MQADGGKSFDDINVTPMVDLYLVLLLIFIIMTTAGVQGIKVDLPKGTDSGLIDAERVLARVKGIGFTRFTAADVVRHPLVARIVEAYERQPPGSLRSRPPKGARSGPGDSDPEPAQSPEAGA